MSGDSWMRRVATGAGGFLWGFIQFAWPQVTAGAILAAVVATVNGAIAWVQNPHVYVPALVFGYFFVLASLARRRRVQHVPEYEYGLTNDGQWNAILGKFPSNHPTDPNVDGIMIVVNIRSACSVPIRLAVEEFDVRLDGRAHPDQPPVKEVFLPRFAAKGIKSAIVVRDPKKAHLSGSATLKLLYGPLKGEATRRYTLKCD